MLYQDRHHLVTELVAAPILRRRGRNILWWALRARRCHRTRIGMARYGALHRRLASEPFLRRRESPKRMSARSVIANYPRAIYLISSPCESLTSTRAYGVIAHTARQMRLQAGTTNNLRPRRGGQECTSTQQRRRTVSTTPSAPYAWRSSRWVSPWPVWNVYVASTRRAFPRGSSSIPGGVPSTNMAALDTSGGVFSLRVDTLWRWVWVLTTLRGNG